MNERFVEKSCVDFTRALSSKAPVPGGGGAAALCGALGTALCSMVCNLTVGRKKYAAVEEDVKIILAKAEIVQMRLLQLVDEDALNFEPLAKAYAIPKDNPGRDAVLEEVTVAACKAPMEMMHYCCRAVDLLEEALKKGSVTLVSDVGCGVQCCRAAIESAAMNVFVNTKTLKRADVKEQLNREADLMLKTYVPKAQAISDEVVRRLRPEA